MMKDPECEEYQKIVSWFGTIMLERLVKNKSKSGWMSCECELHYLFRRLLEETAELMEAYYESPTGRVEREAADVANFALMIAHRAATSLGRFP